MSNVLSMLYLMKRLASRGVPITPQDIELVMKEIIDGMPKSKRPTRRDYLRGGFVMVETFPTEANEPLR